MSTRSEDRTTPGSLGERLASWLEDLQLVEHLESAGLPRLERDSEGAARWIDPKTGEELTEEQLRDLDRLLHRQGEDPRHAVPLPLLQIAHQAQVRQVLLDSPWFTYDTLAHLRGTSTNATRFEVHKAAEEHRVLVISNQGRVIIPGFQFDGHGQARPEIVRIIELLIDAGMDPWRTWGWLTQPVALLGGGIPAQVAADPQEGELAFTAATWLAERVRASE